MWCWHSGTRFGETDWWGKPPYWRSARRAGADPGRSGRGFALGQNKPVDVAVVADIRAFLAALIGEAERDVTAPDKIEAFRKAGASRLCGGTARLILASFEEIRSPPKSNGVHSAWVPHVCRKIFDDDAVLVADGGNATVWANMFHEVRVTALDALLPTNSECWAPASHRRLAPRSRGPRVPSIASSEMARWAFIRRRWRRPYAMICP